jgi:DNA polymerase IV
MGRQFFVDMNAFFASVEQQERPELRGKPVAVVPLLCDATCAIAASYEAKGWGIKTGTSVKAAKKLCPEVKIVQARPELYLDYHARILDVMNNHFATIRPLSVDEMTCTIPQVYSDERALADAVKAEMRKSLGDWMRCSVGIADNVFLAKVAADRQKPNGLTIYRKSDLPHALYDLHLLDLPGIANRMLARLEQHNIRTVQDLWAADRIELRRAWGSIVGARWYEMLRGSQIADYGMFIGQPRKSVGHSHVLPPEFRDREGALEIVMRLMTKALKRLRDYRQIASGVEVRIDFRKTTTYKEYSWRKRSTKHLHSADDVTWTKIVRRILAAMPQLGGREEAIRASITFTGLLRENDQTLSLFAEDETKAASLSAVRDMLAKKGCHLDVGGVFWNVNEAPMRIAFGPPQ